MIDATILARHRAIVARSRFDPLREATDTGYRKGRGAWENWTLSGLPGDVPFTGTLPPILRGDFLTEYEARRSRTTGQSILGRKTLTSMGTATHSKNVDAIRPLDYEARISRRLGFKARNSAPTFVYWRHDPIARFEANGPRPHIYVTHYHTGGEAIQTRALMAINPLLDFLMCGVRITSGGVEFVRRHGHGDPAFPHTLNKPGLYFPVAGKGTGSPFWTVTGVEFVSNDPVAYAGGAEYPERRPFPAAGALGLVPASSLTEQFSDELDGLI